VRSEVDVLIVGARCAGATLATFLARAGVRVRVLERAALHTDHVLSTHLVHPLGMSVLDELGVGPAIRACTPATRVIRSVVEDVSADLRSPAGRASYCPRRVVLDALLQDAARSAGAELVDRSRVEGVLRDARGRVCGVHAVGRDGRAYDVRADLVVGADGCSSTVADAVGASFIFAYTGPRAVYWAYFPAPRTWREGDPDAYFSLRGGMFRNLFRTDGDLLLVGTSPPPGGEAAFRATPEGALRADLAMEPWIGPLIAGAAPEGSVRGLLHPRFHVRAPFGDGWALVGDAGVHKDYVLGDGITEALAQSRALARAITTGRHEELVRWGRARDAAALPLFAAARAMTFSLGHDDLMRIGSARLAAWPRLEERLWSMMERTSTPLDDVPFRLGAGMALDAVRMRRWAFFPQALRTALEIAPLAAAAWTSALRAPRRLVDEDPSRQRCAA
jgi:flavin-dependent dehydrogenase